MVIITQSITISTELSQKLIAGAVVSLRQQPDNPKGPAVQVFFEDEFIGYLANGSKTLKPGCKSASMVYQMLSKPNVAGANAKLLESYPYQVDSKNSSSEDEDGNENIITQTHWKAEVYWLPVWESRSEPDKELLLDVGGSNTANPDMHNIIDKLKSSGTVADDMVLKIDTDRAGKQHMQVWRRKLLNSIDKNPAGEVMNPSDELFLAVQSQDSVPVKPVKTLSAKSYQVSVQLNGAELDTFNPNMNEVVENCVMQVRDVKERVLYLLSQNVPSPIIRGVLHNLRAMDDDTRHVQKPRQMYLQTGDHNYLTRALAYHLAGKNIRLVGEKGSGKNTLVSSVCWVMNQPLCRVQGNSDMDKIDLLGGQTLNEKGTAFALSSFVETLQAGGDVVLDEINAIKPEIAIILHSIADDARSIEVPGYGPVSVHPRSHIWATMNEAYVGTGELNSATADRFTPLFLSDQTNLFKLLQTMFPDAEEANLKACSTIYDKVRKAVQEGKCTEDSITTRGYIDAIDASKWLPLRDTLLDNVANRPQDPDERTTIADFIRAVFPA